MSQYAIKHFTPSLVSARLVQEHVVAIRGCSQPPLQWKKVSSCQSSLADLGGWGQDEGGMEVSQNIEVSLTWVVGWPMDGQQESRVDGFRIQHVPDPNPVPR